ncbi:MAG: bacteriohemerythrin [Terriglobales bacterium]|jgi:hemerythrin-like metal-binding protein
MSRHVFGHAEPEVNLAEIDRQHQNLARIIENLQGAIHAMRGEHVIGAVLAEVVTYTIYHFAAEEDLMQKHGFPGLAAHRIEHNELTMKICGFQEEHERKKPEAAERLLECLQHWIEEHTLNRDNEYVQFLNAKGLGEPLVRDRG